MNCLICNTPTRHKFCSKDCKDRLAFAKKMKLPIRIKLNNNTTVVTKKYDQIESLRAKYNQLRAKYNQQVKTMKEKYAELEFSIHEHILLS